MIIDLVCKAVELFAKRTLLWATFNYDLSDGASRVRRQSYFWNTGVGMETSKINEPQKVLGQISGHD